MLARSRKTLLRRAERLAVLILQKERELRCKPVKNLGPGSFLSFIKLQSNLKKGNVKEEDFSSLVPRIYEIILFGSVAAGKKKPTDIDLMMLDNGHFSNFFPCTTEKRHTEDWYEDLRDTLLWLMEGWFEVKEKQLQEILRNTKVDLHILPLRFLKSPDFRIEAIEKHKDPNFFRNALGKALRFNRTIRKFEPLTLEYLEKRYRCNLADLRSSA